MKKDFPTNERQDAVTIHGRKVGPDKEIFMVMKVWRSVKIDGRTTFLEISSYQVSVSLNELTKTLPGGTYTTFRTYAGRRFCSLDKQILRLEHSASLAGRRITLKGDEIRSVLRKAVKELSGENELRFRIFVDLEKVLGTIYVMVEWLVTPTVEDYRLGVKLITCSMTRNNPKAKLTQFIPRADKIRQSMPGDIHEAVMVNDRGQILEGLSSNFFAIAHEVLLTDEEKVLSGITRELVIECANRAGYEIRHDPVLVSDLARIDEAFITSASRGVLPVRMIDNQTIGEGVPGMITRNLSVLYQAYILENLEEM